MAKSIVLLIASMLLLFGVAFAGDGDTTATDHYAAYQEALAGNDSETALREAKLAYDSARREWGRKDKRTGLMASNYASQLLVAGDNRGARRAFNECIAIFKAANDESTDKAYCHYYLGVALENTGDEKLAGAAYADAIAVLMPLAQSDQYALTLAADASLAQAKLVVAADFRKPLQYRSAKSFLKKREERFRELQALLRRTEDFNRSAYGKTSMQMVDALMQSAKIATRYFKLKTARDSYARAYRAGVTIYAADDPRLESLFALLLQADLADGSPNTMLIGSRDLSPDPTPIVEEDCAKADLPKEKARDACPTVRFPPKYPNISPYVSGFVVLTFDVLEDGSTANFHVVESKPDGRFEKAAIRAVEKWEYLPPVDENGDVYVRKDVETMITFEIDGKSVPYRERYCFALPQESGTVSTCTNSRALPYYPLSFNQITKTGYALIHYDIRADGRVENVRVAQGWPSGGISEIIREAVETWVYDPPMDSNGDNVPVAGVETVLTFTVEKP